jgi:hypothetical protein
MDSLVASLRKAPKSLLVFSALHLVVGFFLLWVLFSSRCVDDPCPPGYTCFDGCSSLYDPWHEGHIAYFLLPILLLVASSVGLARANRSARMGLIVSIVAFAMVLQLSVSAALVSRRVPPDTSYGWGEVLTEWLFSYSSPFVWAHLAVWVGWVLLDVWFLFLSRARKYFLVAT